MDAYATQSLTESLNLWPAVALAAGHLAAHCDGLLGVGLAERRRNCSNFRFADEGRLLNRGAVLPPPPGGRRTAPIPFQLRRGLGSAAAASADH
jgi:hypothetical protein